MSMTKGVHDCRQIEPPFICGDVDDVSFSLSSFLSPYVLIPWRGFAVF